MIKVAVVGAGNIGRMISNLLLFSGDYQVTLIDSDLTNLASISWPDKQALTKVHLEIKHHQQLAPLLAKHYAVLSASPYFLTCSIAKAAKTANIHYLDLTEDVASSLIVRQLAADSKRAFIPQCGLAPGYISIVSNDIAQDFDQLDSIRMCVGALPQYPSNSLNYNLTWSTDGVINEYCEPCDVIIDGKLTSVPALEQLQHFALDGISYETFNTSGGLGTLANSLAGRVDHLCYQTIRYPGHCQLMKTLLQDLRLKDRRDLLKDVLENAIPSTLQDLVLIFVTVSGRKKHALIQQTYANKIYSQDINGEFCSAIQITTAASICTVLDLLHQGKIQQQGLVLQEQIDLKDFLANRFGQYYQKHNPIHQAA